MGIDPDYYPCWISWSILIRLMPYVIEVDLKIDNDKQSL